MPTEKTWYTQANIDIAQPHSSAYDCAMKILWNLKNALITAGAGTAGHTGAPISGSLWTVKGSSNGSTAGMDATDRWGGSYNISNFVHPGSAFSDSAGSARSWIVLSSPSALQTEIMITTQNSTSSASNAITITYGHTGAFTGGSTTQNPATTTATGITDFVIGEAENTTAFRLHLTRKANGAFVAATTEVATTIKGPQMMIVMNDLEDSVFGVPTYMQLYYVKNADATGPLYNFAAPLRNQAASTVTAGVGNSSGVFALNGSTLSDNVRANQFQMLVPCTGGSSGATAGISSENASTERGVMEGFPVFIWKGSNATNTSGLKGRVADMFFVGGASSALQGTRYPASGNIDYVRYGGYLFPFNIQPTY